MVSRVLGWLLMIEAVFLIFPLITCLIYSETDWLAFAMSVGITAAAGLAMTCFIHPRRSEMGKREGFLLTALVWVVFSFFGMLPFMLSSERLSVSNAFFEAMSGFTTTGCSVLPSVEHLSHGILLWRCFMQWIGVWE